MHLIYVTDSIFNELKDALNQLTSEQFCHPCPVLSGATVGQHIRHTIELYQCLFAGYHTGKVNYELRKRDVRIETDKDFAITQLQRISASIHKENKPIRLESGFGDPEYSVITDTNYYRELIYNLEHTIHHMALIRIGIEAVSDVILPETFGVAPSTIQYRKQQCAP